MGVVTVTWRVLKNFCAPSHIFVISEAKHIKFRVLIDTENS